MGIDPDRWNRIDELFNAALTTDPGERAAWLASSTTDPELRRQVEALLRAHAADVPLLDSGPESLAVVLADDETEPPDEPIGPWRRVRELGRGGMGVVYLAERDDPDFQQRVALKCLRPGFYSRDLIDRFRRERRILAGLAHPNIAKLYDGGLTGSGEPWFAMEYIEGEPIDRYCDQNRLSVPERIDLFLTVCEAVQYAHQRFVVHRDLKPGNVLVSADGHVKLLDFGIAKLLDEDAADDAVTQLGVRPLTPDYASPEQVRGEPASTTADVYSLGIMLHELLTGRKPAWQSRMVASGAAADADIARESPSRSVTRATAEDGDIAARRGTTAKHLGRQLRGDIDTILLTALEPDAGHRYPSVQALLDDLRRARAGRPIAARPATLSYRVTRFVRRNRALTAAALLVFVLAAGYVVTVVVQSRLIAQERDHAEVERARAVQVADVLAGLFASGDPLARERPDTLRVSVVMDRAADRVREQLADQPLVLAQLLTVLSRVQFNLSRYPDALQLAEDAVSIRREQGSARDDDFAEGLTRLGIALQQVNRPADAELAYREALAIHDSLGVPAGQRAKLLVNVAGSLQDQLSFDSAAALYDRAVELWRTETAVDTAALADLLNQQARLAMRMGNDARATEVTGQIVELQRAALGPGHPRLAFDLVNYGAMLVRIGQDSAAEPVLREAIDIAERTVGPDDRIVMEAKQVLGNALARLGRAAEGEPLLAEAVAGKRILLGPAHPQLAAALSTHAEVLSGLGRMDEAIARFREAWEIAGNAGDMRGAGIYRERLGRSRCQAGDTKQALLDFSEGIRILEGAFPASSPFVVAAHRDLGNCHTRLRDWPAAEAELLEAYASAEAGTPAGRTEAMRSAQGLVTLYEAMGQPEKAGPYRAAADSLSRADGPG